MVSHMILMLTLIMEVKSFSALMKMKEKRMDLNRETAMRLWNKSFGKCTKVKDFAGREIAKGAYNDRNSEFGWNVDHILPQSKGGKTADYNLVCCHILTNDEKADKFPGFVANKMRFTILKVENHYEVKPENNVPKSAEKPQKEENWNLYDSASGIRLYKTFKGLQTKKRFVGTIEIILEGIEGADTALTDFIEDLFITEDVQFVGGDNSYYSGTNVRLLIKNYEMPDNADVDNLLDKCILLNTYLFYYFKPIGVVNDYFISYRLDCYKDRKEFYSKDSRVSFLDRYSLTRNDCRLRINSLVIQNSSAKEKFDDSIGWDENLFYDYGYIYTKLSKNLNKEVSGK